MSDHLNISQAALLGVLEGLTEFIPVSSTGHLILLSHVLHSDDATTDTFNIFIQLGAILAVLVLYPREFKKLLDFSGSSGFSGWHGLSKLAAAAIPVCICGALFYKYIKEVLLAPLPVAIALIAGGVAMYFLDHNLRVARVQRLEDLSYRDCVAIGLFQCFALFPGMSRSGSTIIGGLLVGLDRKIAAEFSFLVAVPVMALAVGFDLLESINTLSAADLPIFAFGFIVAFVTALIAIKFFIGLLGKWTLRPFGAYRIILGALVIAALTLP